MASSLVLGYAPAWALRVRRISVQHAFLAVAFVTIGVYFAIPWQAQEFLYLLFPLAAAVAIALGARAQLEEGRLAWYCVAAGQVAFGVGDTIMNVHEFRYQSIAFPSLADPFYLAGYPLLGAGIFLLVRRLYVFEGRWGLLDAGIVTLAFALVQWVFLIDPSLHGAGSAFDRAVLVAYPLGDVLVLAGIARFFVTPAWRTSAYSFLLASGLLLLAADELYGLSPSGYPIWVDAGWLLAYTFIGAAALDPSLRALAAAAPPSSPGLSPVRVLFLGAGLVAAPVTLAAVMLAGRDADSWLYVGVSLALGVLVLARVLGLVRVLDRLRGQLASQNERLREVDRLKDELVSSVTHDLRSPLVTIAGFTELLRDDAADEQARHFLDIVERNARRVLGMVDDLLLTATLRTGPLELVLTEVDLADEARACVEEHAPRAEEQRIALSLEAGSVPLVTADRGRIAQALDNLVGNALKFTPPDGAVAVRVAPAADAVVVEVADTGVGIPAAERDRVFERFVRASTANGVPGSGLGLHIVHAIVEAHGGRVSLASEEGRGTTVRLELRQPAT